MNKRDKKLGIQSLNTTSKRFYQNRLIKSVSSTWQSTCIKDKMPILANLIPSIFAILLVFKFYIHMVTILANLSARCDNFSPGKPIFLKKAMLSSY